MWGTSTRSGRARVFLRRKALPPPSLNRILRKRRSDELRTQPNVWAPTLPQFTSRLLLGVLVQWLRRFAATTNASFCARVSRFTTYSRASAFPADRNASWYTSRTGRWPAVYFAPRPLLCARSRARGSRA